jgi:hypothetical protein
MKQPRGDFKHPTVGDAYAGILLHSPELLGIYVHGSPIDKLLGQVTCGDVGLERAVVLPKGLFPLVLKRLNEVSSSVPYKSPALARWYGQGRIDSFLATRCSKDFLHQYIQQHPDLLARVSDPGLFLNTVSEVDLAIRLHELGLLPENHREHFVATVVAYSIAGEDLHAIENLRIQSVFTSDELSAFRARIRKELIPNLGDVRRTWQSNRDSDQSPDDHIEPLLQSFSALKEEFADDPATINKIENEIQLGRVWIAEKTEDDPKPERPARTFGEVDSPENSLLRSQTRGIFDDVDE